MTEPPRAERALKAMGAEVDLIVLGPDPEGAIDRGIARIEELEARWSRFRPDSETSALTRSAGEFLEVSDDTVLLVQHCVEAWQMTGGSFDPTVLAAVVGAGYDRCFDGLPAERSEPGPGDRSAFWVGAADIEIEGNRVRLPKGAWFDPGGIGKGLAADLIADELVDSGAAQGICVNLGGDVRVKGIGPSGTPGWGIAIENPAGARPLAVVGIGDGAVVTATTPRRSWRVGVRRHHDLIDPVTGQPADTDLVQVSVVAGKAWVAEVLAKAMILRGRERAFDLIDPSVADAMWLADDGATGQTAGFDAYTRR